MRSRPVVLVVAVVLVAAGGAAAWLLRSGSETGSDKAPSAAHVTTVAVTSGAMVETTDARGTLRFSGAGTVTAAASGLVTSLPRAGRVIGPGKTLYTLDTRPVVLFTGSLPAWRTMQIGVADGSDVQQLERGLADLGWFGERPDDVFTPATAAAVRAWQRSLGVDETGAVERSAVVFAKRSQRVDKLSARLGAEVTPGTELYTTTSSTKTVSVDLALDDQDMAVVGTDVDVVLPDGTDLPATVSSIGDAVERGAPDGGTGKVVLPVSLKLTDQAGARKFSRGDVTVRFTSTMGTKLLTVPVAALVAIDARRFGVEVRQSTKEGGTTILPVKVGAFASGRVAITGDGIVRGLRVVVPTT